MILNIHCHELLLDFLNFGEKHPEVNLSDKCSEALIMINNGLLDNKLWALKIRDASAKSPSGFIWGNNFWLGHERYCHLLNDPKRIPLSSRPNRRMHENDTITLSEVQVEYRMFYATHTSPVQFDSEMFDFVGLTIGLCFPRDCGNDVTKMAGVVFESTIFQDSTLYGNISFIKTKTLGLRDGFFREPFTLLMM